MTRVNLKMNDARESAKNSFKTELFCIPSRLAFGKPACSDNTKRIEILHAGSWGLIKTNYLFVKRLRLFFVLIFTLSFCVFSGCIQRESPEGQFPIKPTDPEPVANTSGKTYLALGDSYTIGEGVDSASRYPSQAVAFLTLKGLSFTTIKYVAQTGWTTSNLASAIVSRNITGPFDIVTLLIGVNDQYQKNDTTGYRTRFTQLLETSVTLAGGLKSRVIVLSIPDYGVTLFGAGWPNVGKQIDLFNSINREVTLAYQITYLDITGISRSAAGNKDLILDGGPHFTGKEYGLWAAPLAELIYKVLK